MTWAKINQNICKQIKVLGSMTKIVPGPDWFGPKIGLNLQAGSENTGVHAQIGYQ